MLREFEQFLLRGNVVEALVKDLITPLIAAFGGQPNVAALTFKINKSEFLFGDVINAALAFVIVAAVVFFVVVKPMNLLLTRLRTEPTPHPLPTKHLERRSEVHIDASRCPFWTTQLASAA